MSAEQSSREGQLLFTDKQFIAVISPPLPEGWTLDEPRAGITSKTPIVGEVSGRLVQVFRFDRLSFGMTDRPEAPPEDRRDTVFQSHVQEQISIQQRVGVIGKMALDSELRDVGQAVEIADLLEMHKHKEAALPAVSEQTLTEAEHSIARRLEKLSPIQLRLLSFIHLREKEASTRTGFTIDSLRAQIQRAKTIMEVDTRSALAIAAYEAGVEFVDVRPLPPDRQLTLRERLIACRLAKPNPKIAAELSLSIGQVSGDVSSLLSKTGARTRTELALMALLNKLEPSPEELIDRTPQVLRQFTEGQQQVLPLMHLRNSEIAKILGKSMAAVRLLTEAARMQLGIGSRIGLVLELYDRGLRFDIAVPLCSLADLDGKDVQVGNSLGESNQAIANAMGLEKDEIKNMIDRLKRWTGADTREELALMFREVATEFKVAA